MLINNVSMRKNCSSLGVGRPKRYFRISIDDRWQRHLFPIRNYYRVETTANDLAVAGAPFKEWDLIHVKVGECWA